MRSVASALLGFGMLAFGALTPAPASADCYRNCDREYRPIHHHVRYHRPVHHHVHRVLPSYPVVQYRASSCCGHYLPPACCGHSYYQRAYYARPVSFVRAYVEDSVPYDDGGYDDYSPNGYYVSGLGGFGGAYRGLVSWHRYGHYDAGRHGYVGFRHAHFGGFHRFR